MPSTKKLLIMRHAKSSWKHSGLRDFDRPLNKRGKADAPKMGRYLRSLNLVPDQVFSSPAERAKSTTLLVTQELNIPEKSIIWNKDFYHNGGEAYLNAIRNANDNSAIVMTVGHNPMTEDVISTLSGHTTGAYIKTATIACFEFENDSWHDIQPGANFLKWVKGPKDLP